MSGSRVRQNTRCDYKISNKVMISDREEQQMNDSNVQQNAAEGFSASSFRYSNKTRMYNVRLDESYEIRVTVNNCRKIWFIVILHQETL